MTNAGIAKTIKNNSTIPHGFDKNLAVNLRATLINCYWGGHSTYFSLPSNKRLTPRNCNKWTSRCQARNLTQQKHCKILHKMLKPWCWNLEPKWRLYIWNSIENRNCGAEKRHRGFCISERARTEKNTSREQQHAAPPAPRAKRFALIKKPRNAHNVLLVHATSFLWRRRLRKSAQFKPWMMKHNNCRSMCKMGGAVFSRLSSAASALRFDKNEFR